MNPIYNTMFHPISRFQFFTYFSENRGEAYNRNDCMYAWQHADKSKRSMEIVLRNLMRVKEMPQPSSGEERVKSSNKLKGRSLALSLSVFLLSHFYFEF